MSYGIHKLHQFIREQVNIMEEYTMPVKQFRPSNWPEKVAGITSQGTLWGGGTAPNRDKQMVEAGASEAIAFIPSVLEKLGQKSPVTEALIRDYKVFFGLEVTPAESNSTAGLKS
jgi:hypothetical protein